MQACKVPWCVALCQPESVYCAVHRKAPKWAPLPESVQQGLWEFEYEEGTPCEVCSGRGEHQCDDDRCMNWHECGACDGTGEEEGFIARNLVTLEVLECDEDAFKMRFPGVRIQDVKDGIAGNIEAREYPQRSAPMWEIVEELLEKEKACRS